MGSTRSRAEAQVSSNQRNFHTRHATRQESILYCLIKMRGTKLKRCLHGDCEYNENIPGSVFCTWHMGNVIVDFETLCKEDWSRRKCPCHARIGMYYNESAFRSHFTGLQHRRWCQLIVRHTRLQKIWCLIRSLLDRDSSDNVFKWFAKKRPHEG